MSADCLCCREIAGEIELPGGLLIDEEHVVAFHLPPLPQNERPYLGQCLVLARRHVDHFGDLSEAEAEAVGRVGRAVAAALRAEGVERVHLAVIGTGVPHFHLHLFPRYAGTPRGTPWTELDALPGAPHGGATEVAALTNRLRGRIGA